MSTDNTQARLEGVLRANKSLADEVERLRAENRHLRKSGGISFGNSGEVAAYVNRVAVGLHLAAAAAQRNGHNGLAAMLQERANRLTVEGCRDPRVSMLDLDPPYQATSPFLLDVDKQQHLLSALA